MFSTCPVLTPLFPKGLQGLADPLGGHGKAYSSHPRSLPCTSTGFVCRLFLAGRLCLTKPLPSGTLCCDFQELSLFRILSCSSGLWGAELDFKSSNQTPMQLFAVKKGTSPGLSMWELAAIQDSQWQGWEGCRDPSPLAA